MKQVVQEVRSGRTTVRELPTPLTPAGHVLVANVASLVSAGTERYVVELARKSLLGKARERPDQVKRVLQKIRAEGLASTIQQVKAKLDEPMPLGYSTAGVVIECGRGVSEFKPGDRVATAAPHAEVVSIGRNLCARIPVGVSFEQAAYTGVATIALQGVRLAKATLGERVLVVGLGLIGQITVALLKAQGCRVFGVDLESSKLELARTFGADVAALGTPEEAVKRFGNGYGVDAVIITAATASNEPIEFAAEVTRPKGRIVLVGTAGLCIPRPPFFQKELEFTVSASLGPGRWDPVYEEKGTDYPLGHVRWTAQRNMEAVLDMIACGRLPVDKLTTHRFPFERAAEAYELITRPEKQYLGVVLLYPEPSGVLQRRIVLSAKPQVGPLGVSVIGAGNFARLVLMPTLDRIGGFSYRGICTAKGLSAEHTGRNRGFEFATTDAREVLSDDATNIVFVMTRHDLHAELVVAALRARKHVFVEKPLCIMPHELALIEETVSELGESCPILMVGFNRRFARATAAVKRFFAGAGPLSVSYRFSPGPIPSEHWTQDEEVGGGRIVGEACHAIDTCTAIVDAPPVRVFAESAGSQGGLRTTDDRVFITTRHLDGSVCSVSYQSGGDKAFPAERIEVFGGGRTAVIDAWDSVQLWKGGKLVRSNGGKDKGHRSELESFLATCRSGGDWPISWTHLQSVAQASMLAVQSLRDGWAYSLDSAG